MRYDLSTGKPVKLFINDLMIFIDNLFANEKIKLVDIRDILILILVMLNNLSLVEKLDIIHVILKRIESAEIRSNYHLVLDILNNLKKYLKNIDFTLSSYTYFYKRKLAWEIKRTVESDLRKLKGMEFIMRL